MERAGEERGVLSSSVDGAVSPSVDGAVSLSWVFSGAGRLMPRMIAAIRTKAPSMEAVMRAGLRIRSDLIRKRGNCNLQVFCAGS